MRTIERNSGKNYHKPQLLSKRHTRGTTPPPHWTANVAGSAQRARGLPPQATTTRPRARPCGESPSDIDTPTAQMTTQTFSNHYLRGFSHTATLHSLDRHSPHGSSPAANRQQHQEPKQHSDTTALSPPTPTSSANHKPRSTLGNGTFSEFVIMNRTPGIRTKLIAG